MKICSQCGVQNDDAANNCANCGAPLLAPGPAPAPAPAPAQPQSGKGLAIAGMILGICGLVIPYGGLVCAIVGLILSILAMKKIPKGFDGHGMALAGLICSIIGLVASIIIFIACAVAACAVNTAVEGLNASGWDELLSDLSDAFVSVS